MNVHVRTGVRLPAILNPRHYRRPNFAKTLKMAATDTKSKRLICPSCTKPTRICLCNRIRNPGLENSVSVTILQHKLERNHPLNSARIAKLGLKSVTVATVFDVTVEASFDIRLIEPVPESVGNGFGLKGEHGLSSECRRCEKGFEEEISSSIDVNEESCLRNDFSGGLHAKRRVNGTNVVNKSEDLPESDGLVSDQGIDSGTKEGNDAFASEIHSGSLCRLSRLGHKEMAYGDKDDPVISMTIGNYGFINELMCNWVLTDCQKPNFDQLAGSQLALYALARGFIVKKKGKRELVGNMKLEECDEFELKVSPGTLLLFPSETAVSVESLKAMHFEVKNLIVLDGTWSKAKRMYKENPWLKLLPHLRLDLDKMSLYGEVRHQPKAGYLSTIESIVYTLKALGDNSEGLDNLLDVFASMVGDQRQCKDERLNKVSPL